MHAGDRDGIATVEGSARGEPATESNEKKYWRKVACG
jgi:hypothetical protein